MAGDAVTGLSRGTRAEPRSVLPPDPPAVADLLGGLPSGWVVLHDVHRPGSRTPVDHVVLGPGGVFVIDVELWADLAGPGRRPLRVLDRRHLAAARRAAASAEAVAHELPGVGANLVRPVLCLDTGRAVSTVSSGVLVCSTANLVELLTTRSPALTEQGISQLAAQLVRHATPAAAAPGRSRTRAGTLLRTGFQAAVGLGVVALVAVVALNLETIGAHIRAAMSVSTAVVGDTVPVPWSDAHPPVRATVRGVGEVQLADGGAQGVRHLGVRLTLHNVGERVLDIDLTDAVELRPELGRSWSAEPVESPIAGKRLPARLRLPPGESTTGWVVFAVAEEARFDQVSVRFGPEVDDVARWTID